MEREARPPPDLTPVTSRLPDLPPALILSPLCPSSHAYGLRYIYKMVFFIYVIAHGPWSHASVRFFIIMYFEA